MTSALSPFAPDIWVGEGPVVSFVGFPYLTRMVVVRLSGGALFVWSPIALSPEIKAAVDALGPVRFLISPDSDRTSNPGPRRHGDGRRRRLRARGFGWLL